jgi:hypothetical protein
MDTQSFQNLGDCPAQNPSNDFQAGEFAKPSLVSPAVTLGAASLYEFNNGDYTIDPTCNPPSGFKQVCIKCGFDRFMTGVIYLRCPNCELQVVHYCQYQVFPSSSSSKDLQLQLISHLNALLAVPVDSLNVPALLFVTDKLQAVILYDEDGFKRHGLDPDLFRASQLLRFGFEDLTNGSRFGRRVAGVFVDAAFEKLKQAAVILKADSVAVV